jgi:hypothetical protein
MKQTTYFHLVPRLRMNEAAPSVHHIYGVHGDKCTFIITTQIFIKRWYLELENSVEWQDNK